MICNQYHGPDTVPESETEIFNICGRFRAGSGSGSDADLRPVRYRARGCAAGFEPWFFNAGGVAAADGRCVTARLIVSLLFVDSTFRFVVVVSNVTFYSEPRVYNRMSI